MAVVSNKNKYKPRLGVRIGQHWATAKLTFAELIQSPMASVMTILVLAISLTLPGVLFVITDNAKLVTSNWKSEQQLTVYFKPDLSSKAIDKLITEFKVHRKIAAVTYISPEQGLLDFQQSSTLGKVLQGLDSNPLPAVAIVEPVASLKSHKSLLALQKEISRISGVDFVKLDVEWLKKIESLVLLLEQLAMIIASLLLIAAWLVIANTMRLAIVNRRSEIEVMKLVGATDSFIRRPFIYRGCWLGMLSGFFAWLLINWLTQIIQDKLDPMLALYHNDYTLKALDLADLGYLLGITLTLSWLASTNSVSRHIKQFEPK
ncbi:permease-like cell division protein FtsX [Paraferrimonas sp. SM1919]|uniref:permease-like cell division protein FtsX n=1 Tax=Paraferrimonas sp. SM1919 TaxID=2662263 RepID=UPI0013D21589|nr:permease-like cell division protein FtsX [Paraferrimonas sp. SM1919]